MGPLLALPLRTTLSSGVFKVVRVPLPGTAATQGCLSGYYLLEGLKAADSEQLDLYQVQSMTPGSSPIYDGDESPRAKRGIWPE